MTPALAKQRRSTWVCYMLSQVLVPSNVSSKSMASCLSRVPAAAASAELQPRPHQRNTPGTIPSLALRSCAPEKAHDNRRELFVGHPFIHGNQIGIELIGAQLVQFGAWNQFVNLMASGDGVRLSFPGITQTGKLIAFECAFARPQHRAIHTAFEICPPAVMTDRK